MTRLIRLIICIFFVLLLSAGSESRPLNPTMVGMMLQSPYPAPLQVQGSGEAEAPPMHDKQRLSPGGPDAHHHYIKE
ncbi:hypothetical protein L6164_036800 [Bauhinia variegata]|uniref:Uncharacterized protein n=1 Tax=Bauhinia variegata TaxID=167791 RepID=A0ACB9KI95_BAUVA|nr:hypothetical protein L6164_036800 [Bauhinia variegata]